MTEKFPTLALNAPDTHPFVKTIKQIGDRHV